ncbi:MAG: CpsD/CapB family tyrosine-protein kinase [Clostridia bacterium]|nr:CpsD/CapB family tyrosine-protein kinase [Clostridia bacterium]
MSIFKKTKEPVKRKEFLITDGKMDFNITEAFRNFKATLSVSIPKKANGEGIVVMFTSANPGEGKTTVAVNLALMCAISDTRVILVDADVRKGRVGRYFKKKSVPGLTDCLAGQKTLEEVTYHDTTNGNFSYITRGTRSPRPYELLESEEMRKLLQQLKKEYDYVIIDTPPVPALSDALALASQVDGTVVVCRHRHTNVGEIAKTLNTLNYAKANVLGVVVNDYKVESFNKFNKYNEYYKQLEEDKGE